MRSLKLAHEYMEFVVSAIDPTNLICVVIID